MDSQTNKPINFPRLFTLESVSAILGSDLIIVDTNARHLHYVDHHYGISSSKPNVILRTAPDKSATILASAVLRSFSENIEISLSPDQDQNQDSTPNKLRPSGDLFLKSWAFEFTQSTGQVERFEWKRSRGAEVAALKGSHRGLKLVISRTKEVVAVFTNANRIMHEKAKFGFTSKKTLGSRFELMAVISMLAITEAMDRQGANSHGHAGAHAGAMAGATAGATGGGGM